VVASLTHNGRSDPAGLIPSPVRICVGFLERTSDEESTSPLATIQLYKEMPVPSVAQKYKFDAGVEKVFGHCSDPLVVANVLRTYIAALPESLFTAPLEEEFLAIAEMNDNDKMDRLRELVHQLPPCNYATLKLLVKHFCKVLSHSEHNQLSPMILGKHWEGCWPTLLPPLVEYYNLIFAEKLDTQHRQKRENRRAKHLRQKQSKAKEPTKNGLVWQRHNVADVQRAADDLDPPWSLEDRPTCAQGRDCDSQDPQHFVQLHHTH